MNCFLWPADSQECGAGALPPWGHPHVDKNILSMQEKCREAEEKERREKMWICGVYPALKQN